MEWVVTTGRTVEEAKDAALDELGVDEHDAEFEILEEPKVGLFGRQRGEARVRARVRPSVPRPKADRRERRRRRPEGGGGPTAAAAKAGGEPADSDDADAPAAPNGASSGGGGSARGVARSDDEASSGPTSRPRRRRRSRSGAGRPVAEGNGADEDGDDAGLPADDGGMMGEQELDLAQQAEVAEAFVRGLLERFALSAETTTVTIDEETFEVQVSGAELGLLIGPKGQTLQAVQELTRTAVQRKASNRTGRILVDVAGYRVRRREALERFTRQVAEDVQASGVQRVLEPMSPADRKIVHDTANLIPGVRTISEGEEPRRRVVILPDSAGADDPGTDDPGPGEPAAADAG